MDADFRVDIWMLREDGRKEGRTYGSVTISLRNFVGEWMITLRLPLVKQTLFILQKKNLESRVLIISNYVLVLFSFFSHILSVMMATISELTNIWFILVHSHLFQFEFIYAHWSSTGSLYEMMLG